MDKATTALTRRWQPAAAALIAAAMLTACSSQSPSPPGPSSGAETQAVPTPSTADPETTDQLTVAEQPWWQSAPTPSPAPPSGPRRTITVALPGDVLFAPDSAALTPGAATQLTALRQRYLAADPNASITVVGHTDIGRGGPEPTAIVLSTARAQAVRDWLTGRGTRKADITIRGVGDAEPLYPSDTPAHRAANRRCDLIITTTAG